VPAAECEALFKLHESAGGAAWTNRTGWLAATPAFPCGWHGVVCAGGHVTELLLESNNLSGTVPFSLTTLSQLTRLRLADNRLRGEANPSVCNLVDTVTDASFDYNRLTAGSQRARNCLDALDSDWAATQTVPPRHVRVTTIATDSLTLAWTPIHYTGDGGHYQIGVAERPDGPYTPHGVTADKSAAGYVVDGLEPGKTHFVRVRTFTPAHAAQENDQTSDSVMTVATTLADDGGQILLLIYFPADNDLSPWAPGVLERVRRGSLINPNIQALMLVDRLGDHDTRLFEIHAGAVTTSTAVLDEWGQDELDTTDPAVLSWFLRYGRSRYPATRTIVSLMGHGMGLMPEFDWLVEQGPGEDPVPQPGLPPLPRGLEATPGDITNNGGFLSTLDFRAALDEATNNGADPFDLLFFDQCFQGSLDVLYELRSAARVFVASPNYAWLSAPYHQYLSAFAPSAAPAQMADVLIRLYEGSLTNDHPNAIFWLRAADIEPIANAASTLAGALQAALNGGRAPAILAAAQQSLYVDTTQCGSDILTLGPPDELLGAGSFARRLQEQFPAPDAFGVNTAADALITELERVDGAARIGNPYLAPDETWDYRDSLTLLAPLNRDAPGNVAWRASIYTADYSDSAPLTAVWSPAPTQTVRISETFALAQDGAWKDFLSAWYTAPLTPTLGEWCQYIPPALVTGEVTETLALDLQPSNGSLALSWTETSFDDAAGYWLMRRRESDVSWVVLAALPFSQTTYTADAPAAGETHQFMVVAQDALGLTLAQSNSAQYTAPGVRSFLPLVPGNGAP
jgi:hypothetical protein